MKLQKEKNNLSREQAEQIYYDLKKNLENFKKGGGEKPPTKGKTRKMSPEMYAKAQAAAGQTRTAAGGRRTMMRRPSAGQKAAVVFVLLFVVGKFAVGVLEHSGFAEVKNAQAAFVQNVTKRQGLTYTRQEKRILTALDGRRVELEKRDRKLDRREQDIERREKEFALKLTELRDLSEQLKATRTKTERKKENNLEQLANVYGSMKPDEAAQLIEQLDVTISIELLDRMPEKRIGQILALMSPQKALMLTKMLTR